MREDKNNGIEMTEAAKEARRAYQREWRRKNKDKVAAQQKRHWEKEAMLRAQRGAAEHDRAEAERRAAIEAAAAEMAARRAAAKDQNRNADRDPAPAA